MKETSWFGHVEFEKTVEFSVRLNQICRLLDHTLENWQRNVLERIIIIIILQVGKEKRKGPLHGRQSGFGGALGGGRGFGDLEKGKRNL